MWNFTLPAPKASLLGWTNHSAGLSVLLDHRRESGATLLKYPPLAALDSSFSAAWNPFHLITPAEGIQQIQIHFHAPDTSTQDLTPTPFVKYAAPCLLNMHLYQSWSHRHDFHWYHTQRRFWKGWELWIKLICHILCSLTWLALYVFFQ